jgi:anti-sigma B factor antagonist
VQLDAAAGAPPETLTLSGRLGAPTAGALTQALDEVVRSGRARVVLDCSRVEYVSSAGLAVLEDAAERMKQAGGALVLRGLNEAVRVSLEVSTAGAQLDWTDAPP